MTILTTKQKTNKLYRQQCAENYKRNGPVSYLRCAKCLEKKDSSAFYRCVSNPTGLASYCKPCYRAYSQARTKGVTEQFVRELLVKQNNKCAGCKKIFTKTPCLDHCHKTGRVRGLLCGLCNTCIGSFRDDPRIVRQAILYLENSRLTQNAA